MKLLNIFLLVLVTSVFSSDDVWQHSQAIVVQLGMRSKYGEQFEYPVQFVVTDPTGKTFKVDRVVQGSGDWVFTYFPDNFNTYLKPGDYKWVGLVNGVETATGMFRLSSMEKGYCNRLDIIKP